VEYEVAFGNPESMFLRSWNKSRKKFDLEDIIRIRNI
jgi:hypothetical protein